MLSILRWLISNSRWVLNERGGGSDTKVVQAPTEPAPSAKESAKDIYEARLQYDPLVAEMEQGLQEEFMPQQTALYNALLNQYQPQAAQLQTDIQKQQMPQLQELQAQLFPQQSQIIESGAERALGALESPYQGALQTAAEQQTLGQIQQPQSPLVQAMAGKAMGGLGTSPMQTLAEAESISGLTPTGLQQDITQQAQEGLTPTGLSPEQQSAIEAIRGRAMEDVQRRMRGRAQLGGQLYGGRPEQLESRAMQQMGQQFAAEDVDRLLQQRAQAMQQALGAGGLQQQQRAQAMQNLMQGAQLAPALTGQQVSTAGQVAGLEAQAQQQALQNAMSMQQAAQQQAAPYINILYPQAQAGQAPVQPYQFESAVPSADVLYNAMFQASQPEQAVVPGRPSPAWKLGGQLAGSAMTAAAIA